MHNEFTAIVEQDGPWHIAYCAEVPGANGQKYARECRQQEPEDRVGQLCERADRGSDGRGKRIEQQQDARSAQVTAAG